MSALIIFDPIDSEKSYYLILRKLSRDMKMESNLLISIPNVKKKKKIKPIQTNQPTPKTPRILGSKISEVCLSHISICSGHLGAPRLSPVGALILVCLYLHNIGRKL